MRLLTKFPLLALLVWIGGCSSDPPTGLEDTIVIDGLRYEGKTSINPQDQVLVTVSVRNVTMQPKRIIAPGGCNPIPQLFLSPDRIGEPVWNGFDLVDASCPAILIDVVLSPSEEREFTSLLIPAEVKGDSLDSATYFVAAFLRTNFDQDTVKIAAGEMTL